MATAKSKSKEPEAHQPRATPPKMPTIQEPNAMAKVRRIYTASGWEPHLAIMEIKNIRTLSLDPRLAAYKTEMLEYLGTLQGV